VKWSAVILLLVPSVALADPGSSPVAMEDHLRLGGAMIQKTGARPGALGGGDFDLRGARFELRAGGITGESGSDLGSRLGIEVGATLEVIAPEVDADPVKAAIDARLLMAAKVYSFDLPFRGALILTVGPEFGYGPKAWWTDEGRFAGVLGARLVLGRDDAQVELEYQLVPHVFTSAEQDLVARHGEQRFLVSGGAGALGIAFGYTYGRETIRGQGFVASSHLFSIALEWRG
jgi:hypothetical protein